MLSDIHELYELRKGSQDEQALEVKKRLAMSDLL